MCLAIIIGKDASKTGSIIFGHNEQNFNRHPVNYQYIKANSDNLQRYKLKEHSFSYLYAEIPKLDYSDNCINEKNVAIAGNGCPSKINKLEKQINKGRVIKGIGQAFPQIIAKYASNAREGIEIVLKLMKDFGYISSGRTYVISDEEEAFVVSVVQGNSWLAYKVPDRAVVVIPNTYVTGRLDIEDFEIEYFGSKDIIKRIQNIKSYSFKDEFAADELNDNLRAKFEIDSRQHYLQEMIIEKEIELENPLKFAVIPKNKLDIRDVMNLLRSHHKSEKVHKIEEKIEASYYRSACNIATQESAIFDFGKNIIWRAMSVPCYSLYIPFFNQVKLPEKLGIKIENHYNPDKRVYEDSTLDYWHFYNFVHKIEKDTLLKEMFIKKREAFENKQFDLVNNINGLKSDDKFNFTKNRLEEAKDLLVNLGDHLND